ncbi:protein FdrA [Pseudonocardia sp. K10HN5]|uniref:Protein FdrA n=2 Tax=Pseudonocardia acidicola TaxID=2724939 RepID=A0ABX1SK34_9PSEU|nr:protein FdrA [Pseudonocardia acidicola]NMI01340.1 protein FdrA [Pseudonocardia acidicola]
MIWDVRLYADTYVDSVIQLSGTRALRATEGVDWASAAMATPGNLETLQAEGFDVTSGDLAAAGANDLFIAIRAESQQVADAAREAGEAAMFSARGGSGEAAAEKPARTLAEAVERQPGSNVAVISVPGDYAALEAHKALSAGLDVLLFSDNVPIEAEIELKDRANRLGLLVMGPGAGTAMLGHTCLGFANVVNRGRVAVVAAAGTGAQEAAGLVDRWGAGVSHVIGLGGRDLNSQVGGRMALSAVKALVEDEGTDVILLVSKPPAVEVAHAVVEAAAGKPLVAALIGVPEDFSAPDGVVVTRTLEAGAVAAMAAVGSKAPDVTEGLVERVRELAAELPEERKLVRGLFSGGTLCYESLVVLADVLGDVYSNTPIDKKLGLPAPEHAHTCLDLGEEEYTKGRPHPMIDPEARIELLREQGADPEVAAIILDVVLGHGAHPDPASELAPICAEIIAGGGPRVITYVLGTEQDPQGYERQRRAFEEAGCLVTETAARASLAAAALATRNPALAATAL